MQNSPDDEYKQKFLEEPWIKNNPYINPNLIQAHLPSFKYFFTECQELEESCSEKVFNHVLSKPNLFESKNAKNLCRNGVPPKYMHDFLLKLFNITNISENNYQSNFELTFKNHDPNNLDDFVPYFTGFKKLSESLPVHYLNEKGILIVKEILWMLNNIYANIEFSPIIIQLISLILIFCNKNETFEIMCKLLEQDYALKETYKIRWRLRFNYNDNIKIITSLTECLKEISVNSCKEVYEHFQKIHFRPEQLYEDLCFGFFCKHFNFYGMIRLLPFFLLEGIKSVYRLIYAIEKVTKENILTVNKADKVIYKMRELCQSLENIKDLFEISYTFQLNRNNNKYDFQQPPEGDPFKNKRNQYYLPKINGDCQVLTDKEIIHLWEILPFEFKIKDAILIYQGSKNGYSLSNILGLEEKYSKNIQILFLIETVNDEKFGFIMSSLTTHTDNKFFRPSSSFLISVKPNLKIYNANDSEEIIYIDTKTFIFGNGPKGPAIQFDEKVQDGYSYEGGCFGNPALVKNDDGHFVIKKIEIFQLE